MDNAILNLYKKCRLCPRKCLVDRTAGNTGFCGAQEQITIASHMAHRFEEPAISGDRGSGAIFFSYCTGRCCYCQNFNYSRGQRGQKTSIEKLADIMLRLQEKQCHNINLVSPTHYVPSIISAIDMARRKNLRIPILYNSSGYESAETIDLLKGYVDIYMPDLKYSNDALAKEHCGFIEYSRHNIAALKKMNEQVGNLIIDKNGIALKGLLIRHLILPGQIENTKRSLELIAENLGTDTHISLMSQYSPTPNVKSDPGLGRRISIIEYQKAQTYMMKMGFKNGWTQNFFKK
ncbi:radical SAM protein [bacterium]|nr:radical SAM protein [bacterium]